MANNKLARYQESLSVIQLTEGINKAIRNAHRLLFDAELLFDKSRFPSAVGLAILAIEEAGKVPILRELAVSKHPEEIKAAWKAYRSHTKKNAMWLFGDLFISGARALEDFRSLFKEDSEHTYILDNLKQISFYTDCLGNAHWSFPEDVIESELAKGIISAAKVCVPKKEVSENELSLWVKHMGPVWKCDLEIMKASLRDWYQEMKISGLYEGSIDEAMRFINGNAYWKH